MTAILLTHGHPDHFGGVPEMARRTGAPVYAADARRGDRVLESGSFEISGLRIDVIAAPGHSSDSLSFHLPDDPDGRVDQMITSLGQIRLLLDTGAPVILPGHGLVVTDPEAQLALALAAREARLAQHEAAVRDGCRTTGEIADRLYGPFDERIRRATEATVRAHLRFLRDHRGLDSSVPIDV